MEETTNKKIIRVKTSHVSILKIIFDTVARIASDCSIVFSPDGINIIKLSDDKTTLVKIVLNSDNFDYFKCRKGITIGIDIFQLNQMFKTIKNNSQIEISMRKDNPNSLYINSHTEDKTVGIEIFTIDINDNYNKTPQKPKNKIVLQSNELYDICKDFGNIATEIEIKIVGNSILFKGKGEGGVITNSLIDKTSKNNDDVRAEGSFDAAKLLLIGKCCKLSDTVQIRLDNDLPLLFIFDAGTIGKMEIFLTPMMK